jgi:MFS family permease
MQTYRANIWKIYTYKFLYMLMFISGVLVPFYLDWGKVSYTQVMILQSFYVIIVLIMEIPTGAIADHFGRKTSLVLAGISSSIATLVYTSVPNFYIFLVGEFFWALGFALLSGCDEAMLYDSLKKINLEAKSKMIIGRLRSFEMAAIMIAAPIGSLIASKIGLRYAMMFVFFPFFSAFLVALTFKEPRIKSEKEEERKYINTLKSGIIYFKDHKILKILTLDLISISALVFFIIWMYQPLLQKLGVPIIYFGLVHAIMSGAQIPVMNGFEKLEKFFGSKKRYLFFSALFPGICFILLGINNNNFLAIVIICLTAGFGLSRNVLFQSYMNKYIESHNRATVISTISMLRSLVCAVMYPLVGLMVEWSLNYSFIIIGALTIICALFSKVEEEHLID